MKFGIIIFPGSNCERDCYFAVDYLGVNAEYIWHQEEEISGYDCVILPGGFSYGDYLRTGAIARFSPIMKALTLYAMEGGLIIGICNGFQILLEAGLLPGAMLVNKNLKFICDYVHLKVENQKTPFTNMIPSGKILRIPIAHYEGNYYADPDTLSELKKYNQILLRYCTEQGEITEKANPNGSIENIAGISNKTGNIFGLMPHPERAITSKLGSSHGQYIFKSIIDTVIIQSRLGAKKS